MRILMKRFHAYSIHLMLTTLRESNMTEIDQKSREKENQISHIIRWQSVLPYHTIFVILHQQLSITSNPMQSFSFGTTTSFHIKCLFFLTLSSQFMTPFILNSVFIYLIEHLTDPHQQLHVYNAYIQTYWAYKAQ